MAGFLSVSFDPNQISDAHSMASVALINAAAAQSDAATVSNAASEAAVKAASSPTSSAPM